MILTTQCVQGGITYSQRHGYSGWVSEERRKPVLGELRLINGSVCACGSIQRSEHGFLLLRYEYLITWYEQSPTLPPHPTSWWTPWGKIPGTESPWSTTSPAPPMPPVKPPAHEG